MLFFLVAIVAAFWLAIFFGFHAASGTSFLDYVRGGYEPLPEGLEEWRAIASEVPSRITEERIFFDEAHPGYLLVQTRTRDAESGKILEVLPERRVPRRRVRS